MTDNHKIKAVIFDLGNVLIDFDHRIAAQKISQLTHKTAEEIFELFFDSPLTGLFEEGRISAQDFFLKVKEMLGLKLDYAQFLPIWNGIFFFTPKNLAVYRLAKALRRNYQLAVLSNVNILHWEYVRKNFNVFDAFDYLIASCEIGLRKPHPLIYKKTLEIMSVLPQEAFYADDRPELTQEAGKLGIRSFVFKDTKQLNKDLIASGVNIN